jgi:branched-chain amino acid aminotransferase
VSVVWLDGELLDKSDAKVGVADHGLLFGDTLTADMRAYGGRVFRLDQHLWRLQEAAADLFFDLPVRGDALAEAITATLAANGRTDGFVKVVVTRGAGPLTLDPRKCGPVTIILAEEAVPFPRELYDCGLDVVTVQGPVSRPFLKAFALRHGCLEGLRRHGPGDVVYEGSETNVGWMAGGGVRVAPASSVTHDAVAELVGATVGRPSYADLLAADEVFLTSAAAEVIAVRSIDGKPVGTGGEGPVTRHLRERFARLVRGQPV